MKVIQANTPSEASLLLHAVFQPALKPTPKPDPKIDSGTPLSSSLQVVLSKLTHTSIRNPGLNTCSKTLDEALLHREKETKKEDRGEPEVPPPYKHTANPNPNSNQALTRRQHCPIGAP